MIDTVIFFGKGGNTMLIVISFTYLLYLVLIFLSRNEKVSGKKWLFQRTLTRMAAWLYQTAPFAGLHSDKVRENLNMLHPAKNAEELLKEYYIQKISRLFLLLFAGNAVITVLLIVAWIDSEIVEGAYILRGAHGEGNKTVEATAYLTRESQVTRFPVQITVSEQGYTREELTAFTDELLTHLPDYILGENDTLDEVRAPLCLQTLYGENPITVNWMSSDYGLIDADGSIYNEELTQPVCVVLTAGLSYAGQPLPYPEEEENDKAYPEEEENDETHSQEAETEISVVLYPKTYTASEQQLLDLQNELQTRNQSTTQSDRMQLPEEVNGYKVRFVERTGQPAQILWLLVLVAAVLLYKQADERLGELVKRKEKALMAEYPEFISKLGLLVNAGMTVRGAIERILELYERQRDDGGRENACYEELKITLYEMENGIYEERAYENLGRRIRLPAYVKLGGLLAQNVKKGTKDLILLLDKETEEAFEQQKAMARKLGEEAGTKLLFPMILMLGVVMILIMVPAFLSYQI